MEQVLRYRTDRVNIPNDLAKNLILASIISILGSCTELIVDCFLGLEFQLLCDLIDCTLW